MDLVQTDQDVLGVLKATPDILKELVMGLSEERLLTRYAEGKWTIKEILVHLIDDERIFSYRALRYARGDETPLHGFDENLYAKTSGANERSLENIFEEYDAVRAATIQLFANLPEDCWLRSGSGIEPGGEVVNRRTVRALAYHLAGHELRHLEVIRERYLGIEGCNA